MDRVQLLVVKRLHLLDLFYQVSFLIIELVVLGTVVVEPRQKLNQLVTVTQQDFLDRTRLVRVRHKHLTTTRNKLTVKLQQPLYLTGLLSSYRQSRVLKSSTSDLLSTESSLTNTAARLFSCCVPTVWNSLPSFVRTADSFTSFRSQLKTHMFPRHL